MDFITILTPFNDELILYPVSRDITKDYISFRMENLDQQDFEGLKMTYDFVVDAREVVKVISSDDNFKWISFIHNAVFDEKLRFCEIYTKIIIKERFA